MRRKIELYIGGSPADISDQGLILYNYAFTDLENPTAVRNSFSKQVTLPGTPANDAIFGHYYRPERTTGAGFNALEKTPFTIYDEKGQVLESGYCRLDSVIRKGGIRTGYKVSLFGLLGDFFYALSYREDGDKMTLADLDYLGTDNPETELDFIITAANVSAAWTRLASNPVSVEQLWDVLNFAPAYEGIPDGDFDANKGFIAGYYNIGLPSQTGYGGGGSSGTASIVIFPSKVDEWAVKDLRCYLQRPVLSWRAFLGAIDRFATAHGWSFDYSDLPGTEYENLWKTLPSIPSLGTFRKGTGSLAATLSSSATSGVTLGTWNLSGLASYTGVTINASLMFALFWDTSGSADTCYFNRATSEASVIFLQVLAYSGSTLLKGSDVLCVGPEALNINPAALAQAAGYTPTGTPSYSYYGTHPAISHSDQWRIPGLLVFNINATGATKFVLKATAYRATGYSGGSSWIPNSVSGGTGSVPVMWKTDGTEVSPDTTSMSSATDDNIVTYTTPNAPRTGAALGKATLLSSKHTPAEYLIGWAKINGFVFRFDSALKKVWLERRDTFYDSGLADIDLTDMVDRGQEITITPLDIQSKWYDFSLEVVQGAFAKEYEGVYGRIYGAQRVNTGYDFDAAAVDLFKGSPFRGAVSALAHGPYWYMALYSTYYRPTPFVTPGSKYILWSTGDGSPAEFDVPSMALSLTAYNATYPGYDLEGVSRLQFADETGKGQDGDDVLVRYLGAETMAKFQLTDDTTDMLLLNDNRPCWNITEGYGKSVPVFSRYTIEDGAVTHSLDFGIPAEVDIPGISFAEDCNVYPRAWRAYMADQLDVDTKVMRCKVHFRGVRVGPELLRRFYWYDGAWWILNKITNYSLTTWDAVECEFVQVKDRYNYINGQQY